MLYRRDYHRQNLYHLSIWSQPMLFYADEKNFLKGTDGDVYNQYKGIKIIYFI